MIQFSRQTTHSFILTAALIGAAVSAHAEGIDTAGTALPINVSHVQEMIMQVPTATNPTGQIGIGTPAPDAHLTVDGPHTGSDPLDVKIDGNTYFAVKNNGATQINTLQLGTSAAQCTAAMAGALRWNATAQTFEGCNGSAWSAFGSSFGVVSNFTPAAGTRYLNNTGAALFVSSICPDSPGSNGKYLAVDLYVYSSSGAVIQVSHGRTSEGGSDAQFNAAPYASAIVPPGYSWSMIVTSNYGTSCVASVTGNRAFP